MHQQQPGLLGGLLGSPGQATPGSDPLGTILANPIGKAALAGVAAIALKKMMSQR